VATRGIDAVRIATSDQLIEVPWKTSQQLRGRLLAAHLDSLEDEFAATGTSTPIVIDLADKEPLLELVLAWIEAVGEEQAVALGGLVALRDALRADLAGPPDPPVGRRARLVVDSNRWRQSSRSPTFGRNYASCSSGTTTCFRGSRPGRSWSGAWPSA
jgi:hypothetical protein